MRSHTVGRLGSKACFAMASITFLYGCSGAQMEKIPKITADRMPASH